MRQWPKHHAVAVLAAVVFMTTPASAQKQELDIDVIPVSGVLTYAREYSPGRYWGVLAGGGWDEIGISITPDRSGTAFHELEQILYVGAMHRWRTRKWDFDVGVRGGLGDLRISGDLPSPFVAVYGSALWGGRRFRIGPRLFVANVSDSGFNDTAVYVDPIALRIIIGR